MAKQHSVAALMDDVRALADQQERVAIGDVVEALGDRSFAPFLVLVPLIDVSPLGGIAGLADRHGRDGDPGRGANSVRAQAPVAARRSKLLIFLQSSI
jgi:hypothetical protein